MKTCTKCNETKPLEEYHKDKKGTLGVRAVCKLCAVMKARKWREENPKRARENVRKWKKKNPEMVREQGRRWVKKYPEKHREYARKNTRKWAKENPEKCIARAAKRRARKLQATPHWLTEYQHKQIELKYWVSQFLTDYTGIQHHVDHIHPLQGENICGLHVPENLQILTAEENLRKSNSH